MKYEIKRYAADPLDVMCSDCPVHEIEYFEGASMEELHQIHKEFIELDESTPDFAKADYEHMTGEKWEATPADFGEFLKNEIANGNIREIA